MRYILTCLTVVLGLLGSAHAQQNPPCCLQTLGEINASGTKSFVAAEKFREGETTGGVSVYSLGRFFKSNFLNKTETNVADVTLHIRVLKKDSSDTMIRNELGSAAEIKLANFWNLLKRQEAGHDKTSRIVAYVRDAKGVLWTMYGYWDANFDGWYIDAIPRSTESAHGVMWPAGYIVGSN
jgi:hypothetical protein